MQPSLPFSFDIRSAALVIVDLRNASPQGRSVVFTRFVAGPQESLLWTWAPQIREPVGCCRLGRRRYYEDIRAERECVAVVDELDPQPGDPIVDKYWYEAFFRTNLEDALRSSGPGRPSITASRPSCCGTACPPSTGSCTRPPSGIWQ